MEISGGQVTAERMDISATALKGYLMTSLTFDVLDACGMLGHPEVST